MKVLLINPPIREHQAPWYFPSGLGYVARSLIDAGHDVEVLEINAHRYPQEKVEKLIKKSSYEVVGIGALVTRYKYIKWLTPLLKEHNPEARVIVGGGVASSIPELLLKNTPTDILCLGEGEITIKEVIHSLENSKDLRPVNGIWFKENGKIVKTPPREQIARLDDIPFPAYDLFPMEIYLRHKAPEHLPIANPNLAMITSRGCPYRCTFCHRVISGKARFRSADNIIEEIRLLKDKYGIRGIVFYDELTIINKKLIYDLCDKLIKQRIDIEWGCSGRVNLVDEDLLRKMKEAGCIWITYGIESGSQKMLDDIRKQVTVEQNRRALEITRKVGIACSPSFMFGTPGETEETIRETVRFVTEMDIKPFTFFYATPYPGTELYEQAKSMGKIDNEEQFVEELEDATKFVVNLTAFSDKELICLKKEAEMEILAGYYRGRKLEYLSRLLKNIGTIPKDLSNYYQMHGFRSTLRRLWQFLGVALYPSGLRK